MIFAMSIRHRPPQLQQTKHSLREPGSVMADTRRITIETSQGDEGFLLRGFTGREGLSQLFHFHLDLLSDNPAIPLDRMLGQRVTLRMTLAEGGDRYINGVVSRFAQSVR